jgi:flagellar motor switch protein FliM
MSPHRNAAASAQLSQSDIDRLLTGEGAPPSPRSRRSMAIEAQVYDFHRPHRVSAERLRTLEAMYGRLVKGCEGWLMGRVRGVLDVKLQSVEQISFGEFVLSLPQSCNSYILDIRGKGADPGEDLGERAVIDIGREFAFFLVDRLFGGGAEAKIPDRALTPIERLAVRVVAERLMTLVTEIWKDHVELEMDLAGFESIPEIIQAAPREAPVLVANLHVRVEGVASMISICLPLSVLETFFVMGTPKSLQHPTAATREGRVQRQITESTLRTMRVEVSARLPEFRLTMRDIAALRVGSLLATGVPVDSSVDLQIGSQSRFRGAAGRVGRKLAVRVVEPLASSPSSAAASPYLTLGTSSDRTT